MTTPTWMSRRDVKRPPIPPEIRRERQLRRSAYHEAGHVASGVAVGFGMPLCISMDRRGDSAAHTRWNHDPLLSACLGTANRERAAMHCLAGYVAECRARGWRDVDPVRYCAARSNWVDGRPVEDAIRPAGWSQHSDIDRVALLYSPQGAPQPLPDPLLRQLWTRTLGLIDDPVVWPALEALATEALTHNGCDRNRLYAWSARFPALENLELRRAARGEE